MRSCLKIAITSPKHSTKNCFCTDRNENQNFSLRNSLKVKDGLLFLKRNYIPKMKKMRSRFSILMKNWLSERMRSFSISIRKKLFFLMKRKPWTNTKCIQTSNYSWYKIRRSCSNHNIQVKTSFSLLSSVSSTRISSSISSFQDLKITTTLLLIELPKTSLNQL